MKYARLSKEQMNAMSEDFAKFLASQGIDKPLWETIKEQENEKAEGLLDIFSDVVWETVLDKTEFVDHISKHVLNLFNFEKDKGHLFSIECKTRDLREDQDLKWVLENLRSEQVEVRTAQKDFLEENRREEIFGFIKQGAVISKGAIFSAIKQAV